MGGITGDTPVHGIALVATHSVHLGMVQGTCEGGPHWPPGIRCTCAWLLAVDKRMVSHLAQQIQFAHGRLDKKHRQVFGSNIKLLVSFLNSTCAT